MLRRMMRNLLKDPSHSRDIRFELLDGLLNLRDEALLPVTRHFRVHAIALAPDSETKKKETPISETVAL